MEGPTTQEGMDPGGVGACGGTCHPGGGEGPPTESGEGWVLRV